MSQPDLASLTGMVLDNGEPVFTEPWQAQAFAMTISLYDQEIFTWTEWANSLSTEVHSGQDRDYYQHWLVALEKLVATKKLTTPEAITQREREWHEAAANTPHGRPIEL